jgi:hypothetical protein
MGKPQQLTLAGIATPDAAAGPRAFVRGVPVDRTGPAQYVHLIRDLNDPERTERPIGGRVDRSPHLTLADVAVTTCCDEILGLLADGRARTFNAIGVELLDHTADTLLGSPYDEALWQLVEAEQLEHTMEAPVLFRRTHVGESP